MVPPLSALSLALYHEALEGGGNQSMGTIKYAKRNFPSSSLRSQFTASQKPPLLFPNAKKLEPATGNQQMGTIFPPSLAHFIRNSLPRCAPQCKEHIGPANGNH